MNVAKLELILDENSRLITENGNSLKVSEVRDGNFFKGLDFSIGEEEINTFPTEFYLSKKELLEDKDIDFELKSGSLFFIDIYDASAYNPVIFLGLVKEDRNLIYPIKNKSIYLAKDMIIPNLGNTNKVDTIYLSENGKSIRDGSLLFNYISSENLTANAILNSVGKIYKLTFKYYISSIGTIPTLTILGADKKVGLNLNYI